MDFDWEDIRYFLETERAGRMNLAARRLKVSHTTVARHIERLERRLGTALFERDVDGMRVTDAGAAVLAHGRLMEDQALALADRIEGNAGTLSGVVRIGAPDGLGNSVLARVLPKLLNEEPDLVVELVPVPQAHKLWKREVDLSISLERPTTGRTALRKLTDYDLRLYASPDLPGLDRASLERLPEFPFVGYVDDLLYTGELDFNRHIAPGLRVVYRGATVVSQLEAVCHGVGMGILPCYLARDRGLVPVVPDDIRLSRSYWLLMPEEYREMNRIRRVSRFIAREIRALAPIFSFSP